MQSFSNNSEDAEDKSWRWSFGVPSFFMCSNCCVSQVCVARWNSQTRRDTVLTQDLVHGEGRTVSMGDTVEVALSSWLLQNNAMGQVCHYKYVFYSEVFKVLDLSFFNTTNARE